MVPPDQLRTVRTVGRVIRDLSQWLVIAVPVLSAPGACAGQRLAAADACVVGATAVVASALVLGARALLATPVADAVSANPSLRPIIASAITVVTSPLAHLAIGVGVVGLGVAVIAWLAGFRPGSRGR